MIKFVIDYEGIPSLNKLYEAKHWATRKAIADNWHEIVYYAVHEQLPDVFIQDYPVHIVLRVYPPDRRRDIGNTISKVIVDGIVKSGLLPDDTLTYVRGESVWFEKVDKENPRIEVEIVQAGKSFNID